MKESRSIKIGIDVFLAGTIAFCEIPRVYLIPRHKFEFFVVFEVFVVQ